MTDDQVEAMIATNLTASIQLARTVIPYPRAQGERLLQLSSTGGHIAFPAFWRRGFDWFGVIRAAFRAWEDRHDGAAAVFMLADALHGAAHSGRQSGTQSGSLSVGQFCRKYSEVL